MAHTQYISVLLNIKDPNISFSQVEDLIYKGKEVKMVYGKLSYPLKKCLNCHTNNRSTKDMIKYGFDTSVIKLGQINFQPLLLKLKKQRYYCKHCQATITVPCSLVERGCYISNHIKQAIMKELGDIQSMTLIAKHFNVSDSTVGKILVETGKMLEPERSSLPKHLAIDEFKSVKSAHSAMSCILMDNLNHTLVDILIDRTQTALRDYFMRYSCEARKGVKTITMDMYSPYYKFLQEIFPNAKIIIDRFHVVQLVNRALNQYRINVMNTYRYRRPTDYTKLKNLWKLVLKNSWRLDIENYQTHRLFDGLMTEKMIVTYLLSIDSRFDLVYNHVNNVKYCIEKHLADKFKTMLEESRKYQLPQKVRTAFNTLQKYLPAIENSLIYTLSNGVVEGTNNKIKNIKRSGFGYRNFYRLRYRILINQNLFRKTNINKKHQSLYYEDEVSVKKEKHKSKHLNCAA